jgi:hypothetical protein
MKIEFENPMSKDQTQKPVNVKEVAHRKQGTRDKLKASLLKHFSHAGWRLKCID